MCSYSRDQQTTNDKMSRRQKCGICQAALFVFLTLVAFALTVVYLYVWDEDGVESAAEPPNNTGASARTTNAPTMSPTTEGFMRCNGLENLCDLPVNNILFATLHNAMATEQDGFLFPNHEFQLEGALEAGYRGINIDIGKCNGEIRLLHETCSLGSRDPVTALTNIGRFLQENPNEVLLINAQINNDSGGEVTIEEMDAGLELIPGLKEQMYAHPGPGTPWPTLRELIEANTRVLFFHYNGQFCSDPDITCPSGFHDWFTYAAETQFSFDDVAALDDKVTSCEITRGENGQRDFFGINVFTRVPSETACAVLNTATFLESHLTECSALNGGLDANLLLVDCWDKGDVLSVVRKYNEAL
jgi:hypothetical protein